MSQGAAFFNFGGKCVLRLLVALDSLRNHYEGPVTIFLKNGCKHSKEAEPDLAKYGDIVWDDFESKAKRNVKCAVKPHLFRQSPYDKTIMFDGDMLFRSQIDTLFQVFGIIRDPETEALHSGPGMLLTRFSTWHTDGGKMQKRVRGFYDWLTPTQQRLLNCRAASGEAMPQEMKIPAINLGLVGWDSRYTDMMNDWEWLLDKRAGKHLADEVSANCMIAMYPGQIAVAKSEWNESCVYKTDDPTKAKILHFHGNKHASPLRPSSRFWLCYLANMLEDGIIDEKYLDWGDASLSDNLKANPNLLQDALEWPEQEKLDAPVE